MIDAEYQRIQDGLGMLVTLMDTMDLPAFIARIERAHSLGAMMDPTVYRNALYAGGVERLNGLRDLAEAAQGMKKAGARLREIVIRTEAKCAAVREGAST